MRAAAAALLASVLMTAAAHAETRTIKLYNTHTKERAAIVYKRDGKFDKAGLAKVNHMLRDWRRNEPTKMDPNLIDLVWTAYQQTGSNDYIHIISGYRSPATNGQLRSRSKGVAKNSQHMLGKAFDFYIPGVPLAKLRAIGLRMQVGGVGFYPTSGSPFVHFDTGSVRHWPRMTRQQLVKVFPDGKTVHVPSDGKPLPGYSQALAAQKTRSKARAIQVAGADIEEDDAPARRTRQTVGEPVVIASVAAEEDEFDDSAEAPVETAAVEPPLPRFSPRPAIDAPVPVPPAMVASAQPLTTEMRPGIGIPDSYFEIEADPAVVAQAPHRPFEFGSASTWNQPSVPTVLAEAMAARDVSRPASLPIPPTAIVATVDVSRPLRAEAMTAAVMNGNNGAIRDVTPVFAYAAAMEVSTPAPKPAVKPIRVAPAMTANGIPLPVANPVFTVAAVEAAPAEPLPIAATGSIPARTPRVPSEELTLTALDTLGLRQWIGTASTRQKQYALLTMPEFGRMPSLLEKPDLAYRAGFSRTGDQQLRTDAFSGPTVQMPTMVDLSSRARLAFR